MFCKPGPGTSLSLSRQSVSQTGLNSEHVAGHEKINGKRNIILLDDGWMMDDDERETESVNGNQGRDNGNGKVAAAAAVGVVVVVIVVEEVVVVL